MNYTQSWRTFLVRLSCISITFSPRDELEKVLKQLGFEVEVYNDLTQSAIEAILEQASKENHLDADCIFVTG